MGELITTLEAARITRHKTRATFLNWAKRFCPEALLRFRGRREILVDKQAMLKYLDQSTPY